MGEAAGYHLISYVSNLFTPHLINEFGWSRSAIALVGSSAFASIVGQPVAGRLTDALGVRRMALIGVVSAPLVLLGLSVMNGALVVYFTLSLLLVLLVGGTTTAPVYSRLIAYRFRRARGIALAVAACAPAAVAAAVIPFLSRLIDVRGWRSGFMALAVYTAIAGAVAILLIPAGADVRPTAGVGTRGRRSYGAIARNRAFQLIMGGFVLCTLSVAMQLSQLKVILLDRGLDSDTGSLAVSLFAFSMMLGRIGCGVALDRFPVHAVSAIALGLPGAGLLILASGTSVMPLIGVAVLLLGLSFGAEGDIVAYAVMKFFNLEIYSTVLGLVFGALALSVAGGSLLLSLMLKLSGNYTSFEVLSGVSALIGGGMFWRLKRVPPMG
jgi:MFS family permease